MSGYSAKHASSCISQVFYKYILYLTTHTLDNLNSIPGTHMDWGENTLQELSSDIHSWLSTHSPQCVHMFVHRSTHTEINKMYKCVLLWSAVMISSLICWGKFWKQKIVCMWKSKCDYLYCPEVPLWHFLVRQTRICLLLLLIRLVLSILHARNRTIYVLSCV